MSAARRIRHGIVTVGVIGTHACGHSTFDPKTFEAVRAAAELVRADAGADRQRLLDAEISRAQGQVRGGEEKAALESYARAAEAYKYLLRFRAMDPEAPGEMVLLRGANRPIAMRYGIPIQERGGGRWVSKKVAVEIFAAKASEALEDARRRTEVPRRSSPIPNP
jgi:hypothetical protein